MVDVNYKRKQIISYVVHRTQQYIFIYTYQKTYYSMIMASSLTPHQRFLPQLETPLPDGFNIIISGFSDSWFYEVVIVLAKIFGLIT